MNERESDPNGAFRGGSAGLEDESGSGSTGTEYERHAPNSADAGGSRPNTGATGDGKDGVDADERQTIVEGTAATSEIADPEAQADAERRGNATPQPR